jgi:hypothetical protein
METYVSATLAPIFASAAFLTGCLFYLLPTIPAVARFLSEEA